MKDAKGHGSNPRGIASVRYKVKDPTWTGTVITHGSKPTKAKVSVTRPVGYTIHDIGPGGAKTLAASGVLAQGAGGQVVNAKDSTAQDRVAADALASGPKSASAPVHDGLSRYAQSDARFRELGGHDARGHVFPNGSRFAYNGPTKKRKGRG